MDPLGFGRLGLPDWRGVGGVKPPAHSPVPDSSPPHGDCKKAVDIAQTANGTISSEETKDAVVGSQKDDNRENVREEDDELGSRCLVKQVYGTTDPLCKCCIVWRDELPGPDNSARNRKAELERDKFAVVRRQTRHGGPNSKWEVHSIIVNSRLIKTKLASVLSGYTDIDSGARELTFTPPFAPFVRRWNRLLAAAADADEEDETTKSHLELLIDVLRPALGGSFETLARLEKTGYITFAALALAFTPGETVLHDDGGTKSAGVLRDFELLSQPMMGGKPYYVFRAHVVETDGKRIGVQEVEWLIHEFKGRRQISSLSVYPISHCGARREQVERELVDRGRVFEALHGQRQALRYYSGQAHSIASTTNAFRMPQQTTKLYPLDGRVIIDAEAYYSLQGECPPVLLPLKLLRKDGDGLNEEDGNDDDDNDTTLNADEESTVAVKKGRPLSDYELLFTVSHVKGFSLKNKRWCQCLVTGIQEVVWVPEAIDKLVLDTEEKSLLLALVSFKEGGQTSTGFDDFIPNKGKGLIILLSGPPGVGKTLTAEAVAEKLQRPLYRLGAGDLGTTISDVENNLQKALDRCGHWNAVLLIDEADVFLEARSVDNVERNELVSTFLRLLEYYEGVMFLTTNRISAIDLAFESRIDISLAYQELDQAARARVWTEFLLAQRINSEVSVSDIEHVLSLRVLNGRQIKSAIKTACILAASEKSLLNLGHLQVVLSVQDKSRGLLYGSRSEF
ncbi:P-loop containing nucleoside triphosphate hydrolase protein [Xylaria scruposa]|nr:P-loop containing nucleoside triphosphate hydrolase protein [Xylaria scruposa]